MVESEGTPAVAQVQAEPAPATIPETPKDFNIFTDINILGWLYLIVFNAVALIGFTIELNEGSLTLAGIVYPFAVSVICAYVCAVFAVGIKGSRTIAFCIGYSIGFVGLVLYGIYTFWVKYNQNKTT